MGGWQQIALDDRPRCCYLILDNSHLMFWLGESDIRIAKFYCFPRRGPSLGSTCNVIKIKERKRAEPDGSARLSSALPLVIISPSLSSFHPSFSALDVVPPPPSSCLPPPLIRSFLPSSCLSPPSSYRLLFPPCRVSPLLSSCYFLLPPRCCIRPCFVVGLSLGP